MGSVQLQFRTLGLQSFSLMVFSLSRSSLSSRILAISFSLFSFCSRMYLSTFSWLRRLTHSRLLSPELQNFVGWRCAVAVREKSRAKASRAVFIFELYPGGGDCA